MTSVRHNDVRRLSHRQSECHQAVTLEGNLKLLDLEFSVFSVSQCELKYCENDLFSNIEKYRQFDRTLILNWEFWFKLMRSC